MERKKIKLVISDFHLSRGKWLENGRINPLEDFHQDERFVEFLNHYSTGIYTDADVELIVNGDFFDPLAVIPLPRTKGKLRALEYPIEVEEPAAVDKFTMILNGHPLAFNGLRTFLKRGKRIVFRWGNHDAAILWPAVQKLLRTYLSPTDPDQLEFQQKPYIFDRICIDHGHQHEVINQFDDNNIFIERKTKDGVKRIQNLPFGSFFVLGFLNQIKLQKSFINQIRPFSAYLKYTFFFEPLFFFINGFNVTWFFIKMRFITHPMRFARLRKTILLVFEIFNQSSLEDVAEDIFSSSKAADLPYDTLIMGHNHQAILRVFPGGKQYVNTGTWIPITSLDMSTLGRQILRTYAFIEYVNDKARVSLKVWNGEPHLMDDFS